MQYSILSQMNPFVKRKKEKFEKIFAWREGMLRMARHAVYLRHSLAQDDVLGWVACRFRGDEVPIETNEPRFPWKNSCIFLPLMI